MAAVGPRRRSSPHLFTKRRRRLPALALVLVLLAGAAGVVWWLRARDSNEPSLVEPVAACDVPVGILEKMWNGYYPGRSGDVLNAEQLPHQFGTRHSTPYAYTQDVPLVLYGPGFIRKGVSSDTPATVADLAPTFAELMDYDEFPERDGRVLEESLLPPSQRNGTPKLVFTVVWDGGGDNVLEQWPDDWPNLKALLDKSASYENATVGSTPSITPSIHATIGTGAFPSTHGLTDTRMRIGREVLDAWEDSSPQFLEVDTLGDMWDIAHGNAPLVGMLARDNWHLGMIGHGSYNPGADQDIAVMDKLGAVEFRTSEEFYELPEYVLGLEGLQEAIDEVDGRDGAVDQRWLGNPIVPFDGRIRETPAWSIYQTDRTFQILDNEGFGQDDLTDLFYANYKSTDLVGHSYNMVEPEEGEVLREQDVQLARLIEGLDERVGKKNYVLALTADHGMTPYPRVTGGWAIETPDMTSDIEKRFDPKTPDRHLIMSNRGYQLMLDPKELRANDVTPAEVATFVRNYKIGDNVTSSNRILARFEDRTDEHLFLTALTPRELKAALSCARKR